VGKELLLWLSELKNYFSGKRTCAVVLRSKKNNFIGKRTSAVVLGVEK
jgi:hypothetical protein